MYPYFESDRIPVKCAPSARQLAVEQMEFYAFAHFTVNTFTAFFEQSYCKVAICFHWDWSEPHAESTLVEWLIRRIEHETHCMALAAQENKLCTLTLLNLGAQESLNIFITIIAYLLEFINGYNTRLIGRL